MQFSCLIKSRSSAVAGVPMTSNILESWSFLS